MHFDCRDDIIQLTPQWKGERFPNGRPNVPENVIRRIAHATTEEAWGLLVERGYNYQFEGEWLNVHPERILVGRAVTCVFVPKRPDLDETLMELGQKQEGRIGWFNSWAIETLVEGDVVVVDLFGKIYEGTFTGGNLSTSIATRTKRGQVIFGGMRDLQQVVDIPNLSTFCKGVDPTGIGNVTMVGLNTPCRVGRAICMPGDVVLGTPSGVLFIPPHLAEEVANRAYDTALRDKFGLGRLREGRYTSSQMDSKWTEDIDADFAEWSKTNSLDW
jgi:regulator of RNase E activity RraA